MDASARTAFPGSPAGQLLDRARRVGPPIALACGIAAGWRAWHVGDLLGAAERGAIAWLAAAILWSVGIRVCERVVFAPRPPWAVEPAEAHAAEERTRH